MTHDRGDWTQTYTGGRFYPLDPRPEEVDRVDIAHHLSLLCRFGGAVKVHYSVAQHCVLLSQHVAPEFALTALLHDAAEAYVVDVPRPLKRYLTNYGTIETSVLHAIFTHFNAPFYGTLPMPVQVADTRIMLTERNALMRAPSAPWRADELFEPLPAEIDPWSARLAEVRYLDRLQELLAPKETGQS